MTLAPGETDFAIARAGAIFFEARRDHGAARIEVAGEPTEGA